MRWKFIDRVVETDELETIVGEITFPREAEWHQDHFPGRAIVPGVLQIEVVANLAGKLILLRSLREAGEWVAPILLKATDCRFRDMVLPGQLVRAEVRIEKYSRRIVYSSGTLSVDGKPRADIQVASARADIQTVGDPATLLPWQAADILSVYPNPSEALAGVIRAAAAGSPR
jgi:3-hydroxymyristoyl/3-hydroxydecanoyl-(acyl carrier protein) dehydratase